MGSEGLKPVPVSPDILELMRRADARKDQVRTASGLVAFLAGEAVGHPVTFAKFMWMKVTRVWYATHEGYQETRTMALQGVFTLVALVGIWILRKQDAATAAGLVVFTLYFWGMAALVLPLLRYMVPVTVVLMVPIGVAVLAAARRIRQGSESN